MARALLGYVGNGNVQVLAHEVARLRRRVADLEQELEALRESNRAEIVDIELRRIAEDATPALA